MRIYLLIMAAAAAVSFLATPMVRSVAWRWGAVKPVRARDVHNTPTPRLGGVGIFIGLAAAMLFASQIGFLEEQFTDPVLWAVLVCAGLICLLGVADDLWDLDWLTKLVGQTLIAVLLVWQGVQLVTFPVFGLTIGSSRLSMWTTVIVLVVAMNAVNWIDGLDGLAAGVVAIGGAAFFLYTYLLTQITDPTDYSNQATVLMAILVGACVGFLPHNFYPARIFMGDSGAMMLGLVMGAAGIVVTGQANPGVLEARQALPAFMPILLPIAVLLLPLLDVTATVLRRVLKGKSPFHADRTHLHHRLLDRGNSMRRAVVILYVWTFAFAFPAALFAMFPQWWVVAGAGVGLLLALIITLVRLPVRTSEGWRRFPAKSAAGSLGASVTTKDD